MRFDHKSCKDHQILGRGKVSQANIHRQSHKLNKSLCRHKDKRVYSRSADKRFFLQPPDNRVHLGAKASQWKAYAHAKPSTFFKGGVDIQYWFFYPFNNSPDPRVAMGTFNHEGDWELVTVTLDAGLQFHSALYAAHNGGKRFYPYKGKRRIRFVDMTHAIVYSAAGSHASYPAAGTWPFDLKGTLKDHVYEGGPRWQTWKSVVNVGERSYPMNGQTFIQYGGRWGEVGSRALRAVGIEDTSGPMGPAFQKSWSR
ncbi:MAG: Vps62-related protein [Gammaproteobacteria bacterium]|nr:Vps62-related protein [Gammaproteobacteria bacterium]